ncbi:hypothetical protein BDW72DRAFT_193640 [Aspergillus terricola var. indicus]
MAVDIHHLWCLYDRLASTVPRAYASQLTRAKAVGLLAFSLVPKSPLHTGELFGGLFHLRNWLSEHEADILVARQARRADHQAAGSTLNISWKDITSVLLHWSTWPYLVTCLSGLQCVGGLSTWGTTIIKSIDLSSIRANLLNAPGSLLAGIFGIALSAVVDRYNRFGYAILFVGMWTLAGLIALYCLPVHLKSSWSFYVALSGYSGSAPINVTWLSRNFETPQKRAVAYAVYSKQPLLTPSLALATHLAVSSSPFEC